MPTKLKSTILVSLQFLFILLLATGLHWRDANLLSIAFILFSVVLASWSIYTMRRSKLRISPEPDLHAVLVAEGPYKFIRHPMYAAVLAGCLGLLIAQFSWIRLCMYGALSIDLLIKLSWEEQMLSARFSSYAQYKKNSYKLIPFVF